MKLETLIELCDSLNSPIYMSHPKYTCTHVYIYDFDIIICIIYKIILNKLYFYSIWKYRCSEVECSQNGRSIIVIFKEFKE